MIVRLLCLTATLIAAWLSYINIAFLFLAIIFACLWIELVIKEMLE